MAWHWWVFFGLVTGGQYESHSGCKPYTIPKCEHHIQGPYPACGDSQHTPHCAKECEDGYPISYEEDKHHGESSHHISSNPDAIATEIMTNGPVEAAFTVYEDFLTYKSGEKVAYVTNSKQSGCSLLVLPLYFQNERRNVRGAQPQLCGCQCLPLFWKWSDQKERQML